MREGNRYTATDTGTEIGAGVQHTPCSTVVPETLDYFHRVNRHLILTYTNVCQRWRTKHVATPTLLKTLKVKKPLTLSTIRDVYDAGAGLWVQLLFQSACTSLVCHIYGWNIVDCDVEQETNKETAITWHIIYLWYRYLKNNAACIVLATGPFRYPVRIFCDIDL